MYTGHSLGAALALLNTVYLLLHLPLGTSLSIVGYGMLHFRNDTNEEDNETQDIFEVFATQKQRQDTKVAKIPELTTDSAPIPPPQATDVAPMPPMLPAAPTPTPATAPGRLPQYNYQSHAKDQALIDQLMGWLMTGTLSFNHTGSHPCSQPFHP